MYCVIDFFDENDKIMNTVVLKDGDPAVGFFEKAWKEAKKESKKPEHRKGKSEPTFSDTMRDMLNFRK